MGSEFDSKLQKFVCCLEVEVGGSRVQVEARALAPHFSGLGNLLDCCLEDPHLLIVAVQLHHVRYTYISSVTCERYVGREGEGNIRSQEAK